MLEMSIRCDLLLHHIGNDISIEEFTRQCVQKRFPDCLHAECVHIVRGFVKSIHDIRILAAHPKYLCISGWVKVRNEEFWHYLVVDSALFACEYLVGVCPCYCLSKCILIVRVGLTLEGADGKQVW